MTETPEGRDPAPIIQMSAAVFQDLADVAPAERVEAIRQITALLSSYLPEARP